MELVGAWSSLSDEEVERFLEGTKRFLESMEEARKVVLDTDVLIDFLERKRQSSKAHKKPQKQRHIACNYSN